MDSNIWVVFLFFIVYIINDFFAIINNMKCNEGIFVINIKHIKSNCLINLKKMIVNIFENLLAFDVFHLTKKS
jgi:hypothetical protein